MLLLSKTKYQLEFYINILLSLLMIFLELNLDSVVPKNVMGEPDIIPLNFKKCNY